MEENFVGYQGLTDEAKAAFEAKWTTDGLASYGMYRKANGDLQNQIIEIALLLSTVITLAGGTLIWIANRFAKPIDAYTKTFAEEAAKDQYKALKAWFSSYREENPEPATNAAQIEEGCMAAESAQGQPIKLSLKVHTPEVEVAISSPGNFTKEEQALTYFMFGELITKKAEQIVMTRNPVFSQLTAQISPTGFRIRWFDQPFIRMQQDFDLAGQADGEPYKQPEETKADVNEMRIRFMNTLPNELKESAQKYFDQHEPSSNHDRP